PSPLDGLGCSIEAVTSSSPPAGAPTLAEVVWMRPEVQVLPEPSAVMSRSPLPSRWTLLVEFVIVSISPVPKFDPGPVSYCHCEPAPEPADPLKSSLNWVVQPDGGPGTAPGAAGWAGAEMCESAAVWAVAVEAVIASTGRAATATAIAA